MSVILQSSGGGQITLQEPTTASNFTQTLPAASGTTLLTDVAGTIGLNATGSNIITASTNGAERMRIDASGNVGIGTSSPDAKLEIAVGDNGAINIEQTGSNQTGYLNFRDTDGTLSGRFSYDHGNDSMRFTTNALERMRIDSSGNLLVGTTSLIGNGKLNVNFAGGSGSSRGITAYSNSTAGTAMFSCNNANGIVGEIVSTNSSTAYNTSSDYRLKENIVPMTGALGVVQQLKPVTYNWKADGSNGQGFIAHELQSVVPDCVTGEKDAMRTEQYEISPAIPATFDEEGNELTPAVEAVMGEREVPQYQGIDTSFLVATLTAAIQELKATVDAQALEIQALKGAA